MMMGARGALVLGALVCLFGMFGPYHGLERAVIPWDKASHVLAFYGLTLLSFLAFPKNRRSDILWIVLVVAGASEAGQPFFGHDGELGDFLADAAGAIAVMASSHSEQLRRRVREDPEGAVFPAGRRRRAGAEGDWGERVNRRAAAIKAPG
jgi:VanZ family protein